VVTNCCLGWGFWIALKFSDEDIYIGDYVVAKLETASTGKFFNSGEDKDVSVYKRFEKLGASKDLTQMVTTNPEFLKD
jgi:hypothetical protein